ncbi:MAG: RNA degradosome polyphosphate kinase, partial [Rhodoluna sp.]|nr:RNA degradosome polyphosphate kinase [Rhodoluna sp.]
MAINLPQSVDNFSADRFLDRELSWLAFNQRVLEMAEDPNLYLLERVNFLAIFASNLDEFFMVRVAGLKRRIATGLAITSASGLSPQEVLTQISLEAHRLQERHAKTFIDDIKPQLKEKGIKLVRWAALEESEKASLGEYFQNQIFPVLTPLAVDPAHPFPYISGLSLNLAVVIRNKATGKEHFARVKVPPLLPRFVRIPGNTGVQDVRFVPLEDIIGEFLGQL